MDRVGKRLSLGVGTIWLVGCSALLDVDDQQCRTDSDCSAKQLGDRCVDNVCQQAADTVCNDDSACSEPAPLCQNSMCKSIEDVFYCPPEQATTSSTVTYSFKVRDFLNRDAVPANIVAKACRNSDVKCESEVDSYKDSDGTGNVVLHSPVDVPVYFEVTSDNALTVLMFDSGATYSPKVDRVLRDVMVPTEAYAAEVGTLAMVDYTPATEGVLIVQVLDCADMPASGISFTKTPGKGDSFVFVNHIPNANETMTQYDPVYDQAYGGFVGLVPGIVGINAYWKGTLLANGGTSFNALVRAGTITYVDLRFFQE